jgi:PiT family inorganic phosphate transporter
VRWGVAGNILLAWLLTIPMAALVGGAMELITRIDGGDVMVVLVVGAVGLAVALARRWELRKVVPSTS